MKLYEVNHEIEALIDQLEPDPVTGEVPVNEDEIIGKLNTLAMKREDILQYLAKLALDAKANVQSLRAEEKRLRMSFEIKDYFPETRNHDPAVDKVFRTAALMGLKPARMEEPWLASEDFGRFLRECPGAMFYIGNGEDHPPVHTAPFDFNDRILETAVDMFIGLACGAE